MLNPKKKVLTYGGIGIFLVFFIPFIHSLFYTSLVNPSASILLEDRNHKFIAAIADQDENYGYWPLPNPIPGQVKLMTLAAEDRRFESHYGVDLKSVARAFWHNYIDKKGYSGASTIAMQLARLQSDFSGNRKVENKKFFKFYHKIKDAYTAVWLTFRHGRVQVLEQYLKLAPYGNRISSINFASRRYFHKPLVDLSFAESALLAALPKAPSRFNPYRFTAFEKCKKRALLILKRAESYGWITLKDLKEAEIELKYKESPRMELRSENTLHAVLQIKNDLEKSPPLNLDRQKPMLQSSLDLEMQDSLQKLMHHYLNDLRKKDAENMALIVMDKKTGEILSYLGSDFYGDDFHSGKTNFAEINRSTGSLLKPFIFGLGMEWKGYNSSTVLTDIGHNFSSGEDAFIPQNYDHKFLGPVLYKVALANSRNIPAVQVLKDVGIDITYKKFAELGLVPDNDRWEHYGLGMALGGIYTSLHKLCDSYLIMANQGQQTKGTWFKSDVVNKSLGLNTQKQIISSETSLQLQRYLSDAQARLPTFKRGGFLDYPFPVALKTGTSQGFRDAWTIGWSEKYLVGVWVGRADNGKTKRLSGYTAAAPVVKNIFRVLETEKFEGTNNTLFEPPRGFKPFEISRLTGHLSSFSSPFTTVEYYKPGSEPLTLSGDQKWIEVDKRNGLLAGPKCTPDTKERRKFLVLASPFMKWAKNQGFNTPPTEWSPFCTQEFIPETYKVEVKHPPRKSRIFIDLGMPAELNKMTFKASVEPQSESLIWIINGKEVGVSKAPYDFSFQLKPGNYKIQAQVPYTQERSDVSELTIF